MIFSCGGPHMDLHMDIPTEENRIPIPTQFHGYGDPYWVIPCQNHPMISPTISDLRWLVKSLTLHTASLLLVYCILKVTAHFIGYFSRNSISNFQKFLKKFQNRTFLKFVPSKHFLITFLVNVQST